MSVSAAQLLLSPLFLAAGLWAWKWLSWRRRNPAGLPMPPGPKGYPIIGNVLDMPQKATWLTFREWAKQYGDIVSVDILGTKIVIMNTAKPAYDTFEKRGAIYSDRPRMIFLKELMGWDVSFTVMAYGDDWKTHRRVFHQHFNPSVVSQYLPVQIKHARAMLSRLLDDPKSLYEQSKFVTASIILDVTYGKSIADPHDELVTRAEEVIQYVALASVPGSFLVDFLPIMKYIPEWFPGAGFQRWASKGRRMVNEMMEGPWETIKKELRLGSAQVCFATKLIEELPDGPERANMERISRNAAGVTYGAGNDSTSAAVRSCFLALALHPQFQKKAQEELDRVVGSSRLPDFEDRKNLPYINALLKETIRWTGIAPLGNPHATTADDVYNGYFIPKGTIVIGNSWAMQHNEEDYPNADAFLPDRWIKDGQIDPNVKDPIVAFGFGRRLCPGRFFSDNTLFAVISSVLHVFNIVQSVDEQGKPIPIHNQLFDSGFFIFPEPFQVTMKPRSQEAVRLVHDSAE
uniref:Cytochrome P450 n=1 Tax=Rhodonia placenta TaxID=104341 RepID=F1SY39_9APHY|nr:cytochrome P450 [Postia placenta]